MFVQSTFTIFVSSARSSGLTLGHATIRNSKSWFRPSINFTIPSPGDMQVIWASSRTLSYQLHTIAIPPTEERRYCSWATDSHRLGCASLRSVVTQGGWGWVSGRMRWGDGCGEWFIPFNSERLVPPSIKARTSQKGSIQLTEDVKPASGHTDVCRDEMRHWDNARFTEIEIIKDILASYDGKEKTLDTRIGISGFELRNFWLGQSPVCLLQGVFVFNTRHGLAEKRVACRRLDVPLVSH